MCILTVSKYEFLPQKYLGLSTIEVKRYADIGLPAVYEAASHSKYAHQSYLVFEWLEEIEFAKSGEDALRLIREAERFGIGLVQMKRGDDGVWRFLHILEPEVRDPSPEECNEFIQERFTAEHARIRAAVS